MKDQNMPANPHGLPEMFRPLLWSYVFKTIEPDEHYKEIIINAINYGDLKHWRWLINYYGWDRLREVITTVPVTEFRPRVVRLISLLFHIPQNEFNYAPRGAH